MTKEPNSTLVVTMLRFAQASLTLALVVALVLGWGYWYASGHADLQILVDDHALRTARGAYDSPHDVAVAFRDQSQRLLAEARSVEPQGYLLALHPDAAVGNCQHRSKQPDYSACYKQYSAWSTTWAPLVRRADVTVGTCSLRDVPVTVYESNNEWFLWWVPLPHVGGLPRRYVTLSLAIDSGSCIPVGSTTPRVNRQRRSFESTSLAKHRGKATLRRTEVGGLPLIQPGGQPLDLAVIHVVAHIEF